MARDPEKRKAASRRYYEANKERIKAAAKAYGAAHPKDRKARAIAWRAANRDRVATCAKAYQARVVDERRQKQRDARAANPEHYRRKQRLRMGVKDPTGEARSGRCPICMKEGPLVCDHCHATGEVRGWICGRCNRAIGILGDTLEALERAALYLKYGSP